MTKEGRLRVLVIGAGNIGNVAIELIARLARVGHLVLVDPDHFGHENLRGACIAPRDVGRAKVKVIGGRIGRLWAEWGLASEIEVHVCRAEEIPWGEFYLADIIVSAVDSRAARVYIADAAYQLKRTLIDAGINAELGLVRVSVTLPEADVCAFCDLTAEELAGMMGPQRCLDGRVVPPTAAPAHLGGLAAALQANRVEAVATAKLDRRYDPVDPAKLASALDDVIELATFRCERTIRTRNPSCGAPHERLGSISLWKRDPRDVAVGDLLDGPDAWIEMPGYQFATYVVCPLGHRTRRVRPLTRPRRDDKCGTCEAPVVVDLGSVIERVDWRCIPRGRRHLPLRALGLGHLDILRHGHGDRDRELKMIATETIEEVA